VNPFVHALVLYISAGLLAGLGLLGWSRPFNRAAFWLIAVAFLVHTFARGLADLYFRAGPRSRISIPRRSSSVGDASCWESCWKRSTGWASAT